MSMAALFILFSGLSGYSAVCANDRTEPEHVQGREWTNRRTDCGDFEEVSLSGRRMKWIARNSC